MLRRIRSFRPSHVTVVAYLALFVALGGTAYAAATIGSGQVIDNSLESRDLKDNSAVRSRDVANDTVSGGGLVGPDIRNGSLKGADVDESSFGQVPDADKIDGKDATQIGVNGRTSFGVGSAASASESPKQVRADCPSGTVLVGTGYDISGGKTGDPPNVLSNVVLDALSPGTATVVAEAYEEEPTSANWNLTVFVVCAKAP